MMNGLRFVDAENLKGKFNAKWQDSGGWRFFWPEGKELGDATTLRDPSIVDSIKADADRQLGR